MGDPSGQISLPHDRASIDISSKLAACKRLGDLSIRLSGPDATVQAKQTSLETAFEFRFEQNNPFHTGVNRPTRFDAEVASCIIRGSVPKAIDGTFYRICADPLFANRTGTHDNWINGDGTVHAWRFSNGVVDFKQKYVRTPRQIYERVARQSLFGSYRNPYSDDPRVFDDIQSSGNTHLLYWYGLLLALKEDSPPMALDPDSLETLGVYDFEGQVISKTFTAHPKQDVTTGETMGYGMEAKGLGSNDLVYYHFDKNGKLLDECWVKTPAVTWTHDMIATKNWVVFHMNNNEYDLEYMKSTNGTHFRMDRWLPNRYGVLPRNNPKSEDIRWFDTLRNHFWAHLANGFEGEDGCIYLDAFVADNDLFDLFPNMHPELETGGAKQMSGKLMRWRIDPHAESNELELPTVLSEVAGEMIRCDDRYSTLPHNHIYACRSAARGGFDGIIHVDVASGVTNVWQAGEGVAVGEPCFIPRTPDAPEGDGWLVTETRDAALRQAHLTVLDATKIAEGPVCVVELPFNLCEGVHGTWVEASRLRSRKPLVDYSGVTPEIYKKFHHDGAPHLYDELVGKPVASQRKDAVKNPWL